MPSTPVLLSSTLTTRLSELLADVEDLLVERKYRPRKDRESFADGQKYLTLYMETLHEIETIGRRVDNAMWGIGIALQSPIPAPETVDEAAQEAAVVEFCDEMLDLQQRIEKFWRVNSDSNEEGVLRGEKIAGCRFIRLEESPIFEAEHLIEEGVFTSVILPVYQTIEEPPPPPPPVDP